MQFKLSVVSAPSPLSPGSCQAVRIAKKVESAICNIAASDSKEVTISIPHDPGRAGKAQSAYLVGQLAGYRVLSERETGHKVTRAGPASSQAEVGNIKVVRGPWNEAFFMELENFPSDKGHDDQVDALSGAVNDFIKPVVAGGLLGFAKKQVAEQKKKQKERNIKEKEAAQAVEKP